MPGFRVRATARPQRQALRACAGNDVLECYFFSGIGGAVFSAGAGGSAGVAPAFCASLSGRAGSGAGVVGRWPPGFDSAGGEFCGVGVGDDCSGGVAWAISGWLVLSWTRESPDITSPITTMAVARRISSL